jgi:isopentenyl-diphosphate delta-isomerase
MDKVVLVNERGEKIGEAVKEVVHTKNTPLHLAFSLFLFNSKGELLLTKRAKSKLTFPGVWTNTVCGHPKPGETNIQAAQRRLKEELGINKIKDIKEVAPYRYTFTDKNGIIENEICPILVAYSDCEPRPNPQEVSDWQWLGWEKFLKKIEQGNNPYSPWCQEEAKVLKSAIAPLI